MSDDTFERRIKPVLFKKASVRVELLDGTVLETTVVNGEVAAFEQWNGVSAAGYDGPQLVLRYALDGSTGFKLHVQGFKPEMSPEAVCAECKHPRREHRFRCLHRTPVVMDLLGLPAHPANPAVGSVGCACPGFR